MMLSKYMIRTKAPLFAFSKLPNYAFLDINDKWFSKGRIRNTKSNTGCIDTS